MFFLPKKYCYANCGPTASPMEEGLLLSMTFRKLQVRERFPTIRPFLAGQRKLLISLRTPQPLYENTSGDAYACRGGNQSN